MPITLNQLVAREVHYCVSGLISTLAGGYTAPENFNAAGTALGEIAEQAFELAYPVDDWAETAVQAGWTVDPADPNWWIHPDHPDARFDDPQRACEKVSGIEEPYQRDVFEHWIVSDWLAEKLAAEGEKVDTDFAGLTVWARTTTSDGVIQRICDKLNAA